MTVLTPQIEPHTLYSNIIIIIKQNMPFEKAPGYYFKDPSQNELSGWCLIKGQEISVGR